MKNTFVFIAFYLNVLLKNRKAAMLLWLTPIFFLLGIGIIASQVLKTDTPVQAFDVAIVNKDQTVETKLLIRQLTESPHLKGIMRTREMNELKASGYMENNEVAATIYIPKGFSKDVTKGKYTSVMLFGNPERPLESQLVRHVMESAADFTSAARSGINTIDYFMEEANFSKKEQKEQFKRNFLSFSLHVLGRGEIFEEKRINSLFQQSLLQYYLISFYILLIMIWSYLGLFLLNIHVKRSINLRLTGLGFSEIQSIFARMVSASLLVICSSIVSMISFLLFYEDYQTLFLELFVGTMITVLIFTTFFTMIEVIVKNERVHLLFSIGIILFGAIVGEHFIPVVYFPDWLQQLNYFSLNGWVLKFMFSLFQEGSDSSSLELGFVLFLILAANLFMTTLILQSRRKVGV